MSDFPNKPAGGSKNKNNNQARHVTGKANISKKSDYATPPKPQNPGKELKEATDMFAPNGQSIKSTILAQKGLKNLADVVAQFDPQGTGQVAPYMYSMLQQILSAAGGNSGSKSSGSAPSPSSKRTVEDALTGALSILANKYSFEQITETFNNALKNNGIKLIDQEYRSIVKNALANLYKNYTLYGPGNMPYFVPSAVVTTIGPVPSPLVTVVPDLYVQQYYYPSQDPYPGYIKWVLPQEDDEAEEIAVFTERKIGDIYYISPDEEIYSLAEQELALALDPYVENKNLTAKILNDLLADETETVEKNKREKSSGKNSSQNLLKLLIQLAGYAGQLTQKQQSVQLPVSVLNKGSINKTQQNFMENISKIRDMKSKGKKASTELSSAISLGLSVLSTVVDKINSDSSGSGSSNAADKVKAAQELYTIIKS